MADSPLTNTGSGASASQEGIAAGAGGAASGPGGISVVGTLNYNQPTTVAPLQPAPPAPPAHFTGREDDLSKFTQLLTSGQSVAITALQGMGGIGKTALALKLAERIRAHFPGGVLWWSLGPSPDVFTALDVRARRARPNADLSALPDAASRASLVRSMLAKLGNLCAIVDDVWDEASARTLMSAIPPGCPILITTRDGDLAKTLRCRVERIDALNEDEAIALLAKLLGPLDGYEPAAREIASAPDYASRTTRRLPGGLPCSTTSNKP